MIKRFRRICQLAVTAAAAGTVIAFAMSHASKAASITFVPASPYVFPETNVGSASAIGLVATFNLDPGQYFSTASLTMPSSPFFYDWPTTCGFDGCDIMLKFAPQTAGSFSSKLTVTLTYSPLFCAEGACSGILGANSQVAADFYFSGKTPGATAAPIPLPASIPLLATGLAVFGYAGRKRRRSGERVV